METRRAKQTSLTLTALLALPFSLAICAEPLDQQEQPRWTIAVYLLDDGQESQLTLTRAQFVASQILFTAGVQVKWRGGRSPHRQTDVPSCSALVDQPVQIQIDFTPPRNPAGHSPDALAFTFPYAESGAVIHILYDRLYSISHDSPRFSGALLGHVMAHEVAHVLQRIDRHSPSGVMKAHWTPRELAYMETRPLAFEDEDLALIRLGLQSWARKACTTADGPASVGTPSPTAKEETLPGRDLEGGQGVLRDRSAKRKKPNLGF